MEKKKLNKVVESFEDWKEVEVNEEDESTELSDDAANSEVEIDVDVITKDDKRVVTLYQNGSTVYIPEDKVDHYMSEIMGLLDTYTVDEE